MSAAPSAHPDFALLSDSWELTLRADGYAANTLSSYRRALAHFAAWLAVHQPAAGPADVTREHVRAWIVHTRETTSSGTARSEFAGVRHFFRWALAEQETGHDPTDGVKTPAPNDTRTELLKVDDIRALLATCTGRDFVSRRDSGIVYLFADGGLRLAELAGLTVDDVDLHERSVLVQGKGTNRSGPRRRTVFLGVKAAQALDRYLRERRRHPYASLAQLWLGDRGRANLTPDGIDAMLKRRAERAGIGHIYPHQFRHTWADGFRAAGGSEGDLMVTGGWRSRAMLDRYGRSNAEGRAREAQRRLSFGDRL
ncbi:tyrosine-type recombinase/integrase [Hamadaea sp. NPDC050747]|uniref:tyrosine-type recombinase/integrase n=1 Tax=Hamadaea sp. NPDC050747 TaxID=3155789 RepID=UPI003406125D